MGLVRLALLPFRTPGALRRSVFGVVAAGVPLIGPLALAGYQLRILRETMAGEPTTLPELDRSGMLFLEGVPIALATWLCRLPASVVVFLPLTDPGTLGGIAWASGAALALAGFALLPGALLWIAGRSGLGAVVLQSGTSFPIYLRLIVILGLMFLARSAMFFELLGSSGSPAGQTMHFLNPFGSAEPVENWPPALAGWLAACAARFWFATVEAALIGTAGRRMGLRPVESGPPRIFGR